MNDALLLAGIGLAAALLAASFTIGTRFHPPGEGYDAERREGHISMALLLAAVLVGAATAWFALTRT